MTAIEPFPATPATDEPPNPLAGYRTLTMDVLEKIRFERVQALEADHFRTRLLLAEVIADDDAAALCNRLGDLERRISVHCDPVEGTPTDGEATSETTGGTEPSDASGVTQGDGPALGPAEDGNNPV